MTRDRFVLAWSLVQIAVVAQALLLFFIWAPWLGAHSREEAIAFYGESAIPQNCEAITVNHGQFSCLSWGTVSSNPWGFAACTVALFASLLFLVLSRIKGKGVFSAGCIEFVREKINRTCFKLGLPETSAKHVRSLISVILFVGVFASVMLVANLFSHVRF
ncbi:hypothetical protein B0B52_16305 [Polaromonas sp. A23]|nr:hypothetical protein B0B52_16305 [Polaromonas sp. A23]